jgi:hypothetical protein
MKVSEGLLYQANQFSRTRSFSLNMELKNELAKIFYELGHGVLNKNCGTCVRIAMDRLNHELLRGDLPKLCQNIDAKPKDVKSPLHFVGIKMEVFNPEKMKYQQLRKFVKNKGIKTEKNPTFDELIKALNE